jgi:hypothetical protein
VIITLVVKISGRVIADNSAETDDNDSINNEEIIMISMVIKIISWLIPTPHRENLTLFCCTTLAVFITENPRAGAQNFTIKLHQAT